METIPWEVDNSKFSDAYIAGFLDGDGSIVATVERRPERRRFPYRIRLKINFTQHIRHRRMIDALQKYFNGYGSVRATKPHNLVELVIQDRQQVKTVLRRLSPLLILKARQAKIMLAIIDIYDGATVQVRSSLSEKEYGRILSMVREIRKMNSRTGGKIEF